VDFDISNTGSREGAEVVQLYLGMPSTNAVPQPPKQLKGFQKVMLKPDKAAHVHLVLEALSVVLGCKESWLDRSPWYLPNYGRLFFPRYPIAR